MKKITILLLLFITFNNYAQDISITKSKIFKDSNRISSLEYSLKDENGGLITIRAFYSSLIKKLKGYYIQHFDANLNLLKEVEYEVDKNELRNAFIKDNKLHLIEYDIDKISFNAVSADLKDLKFSTTEILSLPEDDQPKYYIPFGKIYPKQTNENHAKEVVISENKNYFVINLDIKNRKKETNKIFAFNNNFEKIYEQKIEKNLKDKYFEYQSINIDDNDGTVYLLGKSFENKSTRTKKRGKANYHFELYKLDAKGQKNTSFKRADKFISSLELIKSNNRIACVGFYGKRVQSRINGVSLFNLNPETLQMESEKFVPFSKEFLTDRYGNRDGRKRRKMKKGIRNIDFKSAFMMKNGDILINAEEFDIINHKSTNGSYSSRRTFEFDDIISLRLDKEGNLKWARNINKNETGTKNTSYTSITIGEDSYFFINCSDEIKNLSADRISFKQNKPKNSNLYMIKIDENGELDYKKLIDDKESKVYYKVNNGNVNFNDQTVILIGKKRKKSRILKLEF
jgi:uncharacterized protein YktA (UPF0223 family)